MNMRTGKFAGFLLTILLFGTLTGCSSDGPVEIVFPPAPSPNDISPVPHDATTFSTSVVYTEADIEAIKEPKHIHYGRWNFIAVNPENSHTDNFIVGNKVMRHGIGMYISSSDVRAGRNKDSLIYSLGGRHDTLSFWLGSDSEWSNWENSGSFRITVISDGAVCFDSGYRDYTYYEFVELTIAEVDRLEIQLEKVMGVTHTLNVVLGEFTLYASS
jgi:predicted small lipoprotein YifL